MNRSQLDAHLEQKERELGLAKGELRSIWKQESGQSLDVGLMGQPLSRGRGAAVGPFQVVPYYHPKFPVAGTVQDQADYAAEFYASGGGTPEQRARKYYGTGKAPAGHPTSEQYAQQVASRLPQYAAAQTTPAPVMTDAAPSYPQESTMPPIEQPMPQQQQFQQPAPPQGGFLENWLSNPLTQMGMGILAAPGNNGDPFPAIAHGMNRVQQHLYGRAEADQELYELQTKRALMQRKMAKEDTEAAQVEKLAQYYEKNGQPEMALRIRAGLGAAAAAKAAEFGTGMNVIERDGKYYNIRLANDGTQKLVELPGKPAAFSPEAVLAREQAKESGRVAGKMGTEASLNLPKALEHGQNALALINTLKAHPGRTGATGMSAALGMGSTPLLGSDAYDYSVKLKQLEGQNFLQAFESLRGGGAITEIEGQKATEAIANLDRKQSEEQHAKALDDLASVISVGMERLRRGTAGANLNAAPPAQPVPAVNQGWGIKRKE